MRKFLILSLLFFVMINLSAQTNIFEFNGDADVYFRSVGRGVDGHAGGRAFVHNYGNILTLNYAGDFTGGTEIHSSLNVYGNISLSDNVLLSGEKQITMNLWDNLTHRGKVFGHYAMGWLSDPWYSGSNTLWMSGHGGVKFFTGGEVRMAITSAGNVGIGTENPQNKLDVAGTIHAQEIKVDMENWADYVFDADYKLPSLKDVKAHIDEHKHLPGIPSQETVLENGVNMGEMQVRLLQKVEELTLYVIQQQEEINTLKAKLENK